MRKITSLIVIIISFISCDKKDKINHYLNKIVTQKELIDNGFYKYSYSTVYENEDNKSTDKGKYLVRYDMYSNAKPQKNKDGELCPSQLGAIFKLDSKQKEEMKSYLRNGLKNRIITYLFRNDTLFYKSIIVDSVIPNKIIVDFTSKKKIIKYYDSLKVPVKIIIDGNLSTQERPTLFQINNYKTSIQYSQKYKNYQLFTNYLNESIYYDVLDTWYYGLMRNPHYFLE